MTKTELIDLVAQQVGIPKTRATAIIEAILETMKDSLLKDERIELRGFGSFSTRHYAPKKGRNPSTGETLHVKGKRSVHFKAGKNLRDRVDFDSPEDAKDVKDDKKEAKTSKSTKTSKDAKASKDSKSAKDQKASKASKDKDE